MTPLMARVVNDQVVEYRYISQSEIPPHKQKDWLPVEDHMPPQEPLQVIEGPVVTVEVDKVVRQWSARPMTQSEIESGVDEAVNAVDEVQFLVLEDLYRQVAALGAAQGVSVASVALAEPVVPFKEYMRYLLMRKRGL